MTWATRIAACSCCLVAGLLLGRYASPAKIEVREKIRTVEVERKVHVASVETAKAADDRRVVRRVIRVEVRPDGTRIEDRDEREATHVVTDETARAVEVRTEYIERKVDVSKLRILESRPDWLVSARAGVDVGDMRPVYAGEVGRRLFGGLYLTVSGDSRGAVMGGVTWTW